jgi:hypothetical protein
MTYDQRTRRTQKVRLIRFFALAAVAAATLLATTTYFSLARYSSASGKNRKPALSDFALQKTPSLQALFNQIPLTARVPASAKTQWSLSPSPSEAERATRLAAVLHLDKVNSMTAEQGSIVIVSQKLNRSGTFQVHKRAAALLPGERLEIPRDSLNKKSQKLAVRCIGATPDRQDMPATVTITRTTPSGEKTEEHEISSRGEPTLLSISTGGGETTKIALGWSDKQPGILVVDGEVEEVGETTGHRLFATVDSLPYSLQRFSRLSGILGMSSLEKKIVHPIWPLSTSPKSNAMGLFHGTLPGNLGEFVENEEARTRIRVKAGSALESELGKELRTLRINIQPRRCREECVPVKRRADPLQLGAFDALLTIERTEEIESIAEALFSEKITASSNLFLNLNIMFPSEKLSLRWKGALSSHGSVPLSILSTLFGNSLFSSANQAAHDGEKMSQVETILRAAARSLSLSATAPSVLLVQQSGRPIDPKPYGVDFKLPAGEALLLTPAGGTYAANPGSQRSIFPLLLGTISGTDNQYPFVIQERDREHFLFQDGWVMFPTMADSNFISPKHRAERINPAVYLPFGELSTSFSRIEEVRSGYQVQTLHLLLNGLIPDSSYSLVLKKNEAIHECFSSEKSLAIKRSEVTEADGLKETRLDIKTTDPLLEAKITCVAQLSRETVPHINLQLLDGGLPVDPSIIAVGEYSLTGTLFLLDATTNTLSLPTSGEFYPTAVPPQFDRKRQAKISIWMERFSHVSGRKEAL